VGGFFVRMGEEGVTGVDVAWEEAAAPVGVETAAIDEAGVRGVLVDLFEEGRRCRLLDRYAPGEPQWLLAELGDGRITGGCPERYWRLSCDDPSTAPVSAPPLAADGSDAWRLLDAVVFSPSAQVHVGEAAEAAWLSRDAPDTDGLPAWLRPRDRSFLLVGWRGGGAPQAGGDPARGSRTLLGPIPFSIGRELSGTTAAHPVSWQDFDVERRPAPGGADPRTPTSVGSWISVREYWAEDRATGAVGVAQHRLTGYHAGPKPTAPLGLDELDDA
jgi:hypothetical protein